MLTAKIAEIFKSYQGEGLWQNKEQIFIRFFGCNLDCSYCDTELSFYQVMTPEQVLAKVDNLGKFHSISLTGGEPLLQKDFLAKLCFRLREKGKIIYLETNGTLPQNLKKVIDAIDLVAVDLKLPSSTGQQSYWPKHKDFIQIAQKTNSFAKAVVAKSTTLADLNKAIEIIKKTKPDLLLVLQPENPYEEELEEKLLIFKKKCQEQAISVKIIPQAHKKTGIK